MSELRHFGNCTSHHRNEKQRPLFNKKYPPKPWKKSLQKPLSATRKWFFGHRYVQNVRFLRNSPTGMRENQNLYSPIYLLTKSSLGQMALSENIKSLRGRGVLYSSGREGPFNRGCIRNVLASE